MYPGDSYRVYRCYIYDGRMHASNTSICWKNAKRSPYFNGSVRRTFPRCWGRIRVSV